MEKKCFYKTLHLHFNSFFACLSNFTLKGYSLLSKDLNIYYPFKLTRRITEITISKYVIYKKDQRLRWSKDRYHKKIDICITWHYNCPSCSGQPWPAQPPRSGPRPQEPQQMRTEDTGDRWRLISVTRRHPPHPHTASLASIV